MTVKMHNTDTRATGSVSMIPAAEEPSVRLRTWPVQIATEGGVIHGMIDSLHHRLSDHLLDTGVMIEVRDSTVLPSRATVPIARRSLSYVSQNHVYFVADLSSDQHPLPGAYVPREAEFVTVNVGRFWVSGRVHLPISVDLHHILLSGSTSRFIAMTEGRVHGQESLPQTYLINRDHISSVVAHGSTP